MIEDRTTLAGTPSRELALTCLEAGIRAADPSRAIKDSIVLEADTLQIGDATVELNDFERILVIGGGKASAEMAQSLESMLDERIDDGVIVTTDPIDLDRIAVLRGDHPVPSRRGITATAKLLALLEDVTSETLVLVLISGGGSALLPAPAGDVSLSALQSVTDDLLESGATIHEINTVRKHLSAIKGGRLAMHAQPATVHTLLVSDVVGDDLSVIASGPTVPDPTRYQDALAVLTEYDIIPPVSVRERLAAGAAGELPETPGPGDPAFDCVSHHLIANAGTAARAARAVAQEAGYNALLLSTRIRGESREAALTHVAIGEEICASNQPIDPPAAIISAGETTVTIRGTGTGGPNQEFALRAAVEGAAGITLAAIDTDGIDGGSDAAGGIVDARTVGDRRTAISALEDNDATPYLRDRSGLIITGRTGTNVNDLRVMVVEPVTEDATDG